GRREHLGRGPALLAHAAPVGREVARLDLNRWHGIRDDPQRLRALEGAVGAVGRDRGHGGVRPPTSWRRGARRGPRCERSGGATPGSRNTVTERTSRTTPWRTCRRKG